MSRANIMGQFSLLDTSLTARGYQPPACQSMTSISWKQENERAFATCLWEYAPEVRTTERLSFQMKRLVPAGEYVVRVGDHPLVLCPTDLSPSDIPEGNRFYHYLVGGRVYSGVFVGVEEVA